jgi:hypothetical protein
VIRDHEGIHKEETSYYLKLNNKGIPFLWTLSVNVIEGRLPEGTAGCLSGIAARSSTKKVKSR